MSDDPWSGLGGKVAVITGSTRGLGRAMAEGLARAGASVVVNGRDAERCQRVASELSERYGRPMFAGACHVGDWDALPDLISAVVERFGRIDVLINNAGINPSLTPVIELSPELLRKVWTVNFEGPVRLCQLVAPVMRDGGGGSIVNIGTTGAYAGGQGVGIYGASKAALINISRTMARERGAWDIRVNSLSPGPMITEMTLGAEAKDPEFFRRVGGRTMLGRIGRTEEIVGPVLYLASDASSYVTGEDHLVSGGILRC